ncbi:CaiB/BaiF CoA-transferase family protein [Caballeronia sp. LZ001]|uniref:CaiB/BaiF CoA transferase family protein n=1 Tax=Caballeronia sp. LZ001 TaxID=3038553 RepID=UPI00285EE360|nr:CaiB/BaiF CoA-transferase family protein [Caballeronia sp. LZ001]MDR5804878.1 CaiB/BaiF CoA-transferase family protein [Caballeronia sp. LZ001]
MKAINETNDHAASTRGGPLRGVRVIEMAGIGPGPMCAMLLADLGADVLRIERPGGLNVGIERPLQYDLLRRGRPAITVDLKDPAGVEKVLRLVENADALIEGFRPGVMEKIGLGPEVCVARNRRLVYGRMTGWGQDGPLSRAAGHDINYLAVTGILNAIGRENDAPVAPLNIVGDYAGGALYLAVGLLAAILHARRTGQGQTVDAAIVDGAAHLSTMFHGMVAAGLWQKERGTNVLDSGAPFYDVYRCSDGLWVAVGPIEPKFFGQLLLGLGLDSTSGIGQSPEDWQTTRERIAARFATRTREEFCRQFENTDACVSPVLDWHEATEHPHMRERGTYVDVAGVLQPAAAPRFSATPCSVPTPPQPVDTDHEAVLSAWLSRIL